MKTNTRKLFILFLCIVAAVALFSVTAMAADEDDGYVEIADGYIGEDDEIYWNIFSADGFTTLSINGNGAIPDYASPASTPWAKYREDITFLNIVDSPSYIGSNAFAGFTSLETVMFYGAAPEFGENTFADVNAVCLINGSNDTWIDYVRQDYGGQLEWEEYYDPIDGGLDEDYSDWMYYPNGHLEIYGDAALTDYASSDNTPWAEYRDDITSIIVYDVTHVGSYAFADMKNLEEIGFLSSAPTFGENVFKGVTVSAFYQGDGTWTEDVLQNYGGEITWFTEYENMIIAEGTCGENAYWTLYEDGNFDIYGDGAIYDYPSPDDVPWAEYSDSINTAIIGGFFNFIGENVLSNLSDGCTIMFYGDAPEFGKNVFAGTTGTVFYDFGNETWTDVIKYSYGGEITWKQAGLQGDVNSDGDINNADLILVARYVVELIEPGTSAAYLIETYGDMNYDFEVNNQDVIIIARMIVGLIYSSDADIKAAVLWYDVHDAFISVIRENLYNDLTEAGIAYADYNAGNNQNVQKYQVDRAIDQGADLLIVNIVDTDAIDAAQSICDKAEAADIPIIFVNREVDDSVINSYDQACYVGTRAAEAGEKQGQLAGEYIIAHYDEIDLNKDGEISYIMMKGELGNPEAEARTKYAVEFCNAVLEANGKPDLVYYDANNFDKFEPSMWSHDVGFELMETALSKYPMDSAHPIEVVFANNDDPAIGAIEALNEVGWNTGSGKAIPVFGIDYTAEAEYFMDAGKMTGSILQSATGVAETVAVLAENVKNGKDVFAGARNNFITDIGVNKIRVPYEIKIKAN